MKRTITMNLSGIVFHIEEDAYERLSQYLQAIKGHFKNTEGCDEIMNDIELQIAEMLQGKVSPSKQAVTMADIESVIAVMGNPEAFADDNPENKEASGSDNRQTINNTAYTSSSGRRRIFRDPDDKVIGGVCSGIANYFDFDPIWLRAAFAVSFFAFGTGFLLYIVLMLIIPKARTTAEKLEMRGEKVDVNNIGKAVNEEFQEFKKRVNDFGKEMQSPETKYKVRSSVQQFVDFLKELLYGIFKVFSKGFAVVLLIIGVTLMVGLLATLFGRGTISFFNGYNNRIHFSLYEFSSAVLPDNLPMEYLVVGLILFIGVPLVSMIYAGIRLLFGIKQKNKIWRYTANLLWLTGLGLLIYVGVKLGTDFSEEESNKQNVSIVSPTAKTLYLDMKMMPKDMDNDDENYGRHRHRIRINSWTVFDKQENNFRIGYPTLDIIQSTTDNYELVTVKTANGYDKKEAANRAKNIEYSVSQTDSLLEFNSFFDIPVADKIRAQEVRLLLKVPVGKSVFLSKRMEHIIFDIDNIHDMLDSDMVNHRWVMTEQGLECSDCKELSSKKPDENIDSK